MKMVMLGLTYVTQVLTTNKKNNIVIPKAVILPLEVKEENSKINVDRVKWSPEQKTSF